MNHADAELTAMSRGLRLVWLDNGEATDSGHSEWLVVDRHDDVKVTGTWPDIEAFLSAATDAQR